MQRTIHFAKVSLVYWTRKLLSVSIYWDTTNLRVPLYELLATNLRAALEGCEWGRNWNSAMHYTIESTCLGMYTQRQKEGVENEGASNTEQPSDESRCRDDGHHPQQLGLWTADGAAVLTLLCTHIHDLPHLHVHGLRGILHVNGVRSSPIVFESRVSRQDRGRLKLKCALSRALEVMGGLQAHLPVRLSLSLGKFTVEFETGCHTVVSAYRSSRTHWIRSWCNLSAWQ